MIWGALADFVPSWDDLDHSDRFYPPIRPILPPSGGRGLLYMKIFYALELPKKYFCVNQGSFKWDSTYQKDYPHYMILQTKLQHAGHSNTNVCTGHCFCRHAHLSNQWQFFLSGWLNQPIVSQSSSISCSVDILWMTFPMFISLEISIYIGSLKGCHSLFALFWGHTVNFYFLVSGTFCNGPVV